MLDEYVNIKRKQKIIIGTRKLKKKKRRKEYSRT